MSKIDVHHHVYPQSFSAALNSIGGDPASSWVTPDWKLEVDQEMNQALGVKTAILSVTAPGPAILPNPGEAAKLARQCNKEVAAICESHPAEYGFFACMPSPADTEACISEIKYALDTLHADGVVLLTTYGPGKDRHYLGHADFRPVWAELNRRKAVVFIHPTPGANQELVNPHLPLPMFDYPHETGRTAMDLILSDTLNSVCPDCKIILSHAGGTLPYLIYRPAGMLPYTEFTVNKSTEQIVEEARKYYFDTAISANPYTLDLLFKFAKPGHVLFGSDFPNAPAEGIKYFTKQLDDFEMTDSKRQEVENKAALELFPKFKN